MVKLLIVLYTLAVFSYACLAQQYPNQVQQTPCINVCMQNCRQSEMQSCQHNCQQSCEQSITQPPYASTAPNNRPVYLSPELSQSAPNARAYGNTSLRPSPSYPQSQQIGGINGFTAGTIKNTVCIKVCMPSCTPQCVRQPPLVPGASGGSISVIGGGSDPLIPQRPGPMTAMGAGPGMPSHGITGGSEFIAGGRPGLMMPQRPGPVVPVKGVPLMPPQGAVRGPGSATLGWPAPAIPQGAGPMLPSGLSPVTPPQSIPVMPQAPRPVAARSPQCAPVCLPTCYAQCVQRNTASPQAAQAPLYVPPPSENVLSAPRQRNDCMAVCMPLCSPQCIQNQPQPSPYLSTPIPAQPQPVPFPPEYPSAVPLQPLPFLPEPVQVVPGPLPVPFQQFTPTVPSQPQCIPSVIATECACSRRFMICIPMSGSYQCCRWR